MADSVSAIAGTQERDRVVVLGAGFAGIEVARGLGAAAVPVTLIDRQNHHLFQPLLYQVATAALSPADIAEPIRKMLRGYPSVEVRLDEAIAIDVRSHTLLLASGATLAYGWLVVATGAAHSYFGHDEWAAFAPSLKTIEDARVIRSRLLLSFEEAERSRDLSEQRRLITIAIIGGGPTGVELAGSIAELARYTLARDFRAIRAETATVLLLEAGPRILAAFPEALTGRIAVNPDLSVPGLDRIFVLGDLALLADKRGLPLPGLAQVAKQQGHYLGRALAERIRRDEAPAPFRFHNRGNTAIIGRHAAVFDFGWWQIRGTLAWMFWALIHIYLLVGFQHRLMVAIQWLWRYLTYERGSRLIAEYKRA